MNTRLIFAVAAAALPLSAFADEGGFSQGIYGTHHSCPVTLNEEGTRLEVRTGNSVRFLIVDEELDIMVDYTGREWTYEQTEFEMPQHKIVNQWLIEQGLPTLWDLQADPYACQLSF